MSAYQNLDRMLSCLETVKSLPANEPGLYLHLGCGPQVFPGFVNLDKYETHPQVVQADMMAPPFAPGSVKGIYSSHSLEHLPLRHATLALRNWAKLLQPGGRLFLAVPDLEAIMLIMLDPAVDEGVKWDWYAYTMFGYQVKPGTPQGNLEIDVDPGQFHVSGFTRRRLEALLAQSNLQILDLFHYDGWGTPSIFLEAKRGS